VKLRIWSALIAVYIFWGANFLAIRFAVQSMPPFLMASTRFLFAGAILYVWQRLAGVPDPTRRHWHSAAIIGLLMLTIGVGSVSWASQFVPSGITALLIGSIPIWMVLIDAVHPAYPRPGWAAILGVLVGFGGIALLLSPASQVKDAGVVDLLAGAVPLVGALFWALGSIYDREAPLPKSPLLGTGMIMLLGGSGLLALSLLSGEWGRLDLAAITLRSFAGLAYQVVFGSLIGFAAYAWLLRVAPTPLVASYAYVVPLIAVYLGNLLAGERLTPRILISAVMIVGALVLINSRQISARRSEIKAVHRMAPDSVDGK
jgi:drug/metabolite transporter (DMT)-like permease